MHTASIEQRRDFYRYQTAYAFFIEAYQLLSVLGSSESLPDELRGALWLAYFTAYGKPFKQHKKKGLGLAEDFVPQEFASVHEAHVVLRDKMYAHTDALDLVDSNNRLLNALAVCLSPDGSYIFARATIQPTPLNIVACEALLCALLEKSKSLKEAIWETWLPNLSLTPGVKYEINIGTDSDEVVTISNFR